MAIFRCEFAVPQGSSLSGAAHRCEALVVGSGPGGSVTAWTLAQQGKNVLVIEEGSEFPLGSCQPFSLDELRQKYRAGGMNPSVGSPSIPFVEGRCLGGGSEINSGMYHRTPPETLEFWRKQFGVELLQEENLRPHFEACETALSVRLNPGRLPGPGIKMRHGAESLNWRTKEVPRWFRYQEIPSADRRYSGTRQSMTESLIPVAKSLGCKFLTGARARNISQTQNHWRVEGALGGERIVIDADAVFLCCGAVQTPALLRRAGIRLNVGNSLACHPTIKVVAIFPEEVNDQPEDVAPQQVTEFAPAMSMGCSVSSLPHLAMAMAEHPDAQFALNKDWRRAAIFYAMITGPNTGTVRNVPFSSDPLVRHKLEAEHFRALALALGKLCRLLFAAGAERLYPSIAGCPVLKSESDLAQIPEELPRARTSLMTIHLFSSCPMGSDRERCAVDSFGKVHGYRNLFVNDASLLCTAPGVNPQGTIMALSRRNALHYAKAL